MKRQTMTYWLLMALLLVAAAWSYQFMAAGRDAAIRSCDTLADCRRMARQIESLRTRPALAADQERLASETTGLIEAASQAAKIPSAALVRITPEASRRLGESVYKEKPTHVMLKDATLNQVVEMIYTLAAGERPLHPKAIRLTAPRGQDTGDTWAGEVTLTYLIYDPPESIR